MSELRKELTDSDKPALSNATALYMIRDAVRSKDKLIHGRLRNNGETCSLGAFWDRNSTVTLYTSLVDEVATYNDSMPEVTPKVRRNRVLRWLNWKLRVMDPASRRVK